ncbi:MAG: hypothetical protein M3Z21_00145 [Pseudomonadota bacterium]|nr:hypothetical protein [Pseudomonadota bacterium]
MPIVEIQSDASQIVKRDDKQRIAYGWATVCEAPRGHSPLSRRCRIRA